MYSATLILFRKAEDWNVGESDPKGKDSTINVKTTTEEEKTEKKAEARIRKYRDLKQYYIGSFNVRLDGLEMRFLEKLIHRTVRRQEDPKVFKDMLKLFDPNNLVFKDLMKSDASEYLAALVLKDVVKVNTDTLNFEPKRQRNSAMTDSL